MEYGFSADNVCNGSDTYGNSFTNSVDFTISSQVNNGKYICIKALDTAGNTSYLVSANPLNIDTTAPIITLVGSGSITQEVHTSYTDAGATYTDNIDPSGSVTAIGTVNTNIV